VHLRQKGQQLGAISTSCFSARELLAKIQNFRKQKKPSLLAQISVAKLTYIGKQKAKYRLAVLDLGITQGIIRQLESLGCALQLLPFNATAAEILRLRAEGLIISGAPEEDPGLVQVAENIKPLIGKLPILGISAGHQVIARALGAKLSKLKLGHHGVNYPIHNPASYKGEITVQNHSWAVEAGSLGKIKGLKVSAYNLNDRSVEEIESRRLKIIGVQYVPASPGFEEVNPVFKRFVKMMK
jgi:carbamoyl-phosphate synthase small subunit